MSLVPPWRPRGRDQGNKETDRLEMPNGHGRPQLQLKLAASANKPGSRPGGSILLGFDTMAISRDGQLTGPNRHRVRHGVLRADGIDRSAAD